MSNFIKKIILLLFLSLLIFSTNKSLAQNTGDRVSVKASDGKTYTGFINNIYNGQYQIKYDGYDILYWLTAEQFSLVKINSEPIKKTTSTNNQPTTNTTSTYKKTDKEWLNDIYEFGNQNGWSNIIFKTKYTTYVNQLSITEQKTLLTLIRKATTSSARFFALKSILAGDNYEVIQNFITQLNQFPETEQQEKCLVTNSKSIIQQWQLSCSVTMVQTFLADLSPRYAWDVKQIPNFDIVDTDVNNPLSIQQKQLLEKYGGVASIRGDNSGTPIGIINPLRDFITPILGVNFYALEITEPLPAVFSKIRTQLDNGISVPLLVGLGTSNTMHFVIILRFRNTNKRNEYLIYDPWEGKCDYVLESTIMNGSLSPLLSQYSIKINYYYPTD